MHNQMVHQPHARAAILLAGLIAHGVLSAGCGGGTADAVLNTAADPPVVSLSPASLNFANQAIDTASAAQSVTLTNIGSAVLSPSIAVTGANAGDFVETDTCGGVLAAGATCTIAVLFVPSAYGARTATLGITDSASGSTPTVSLSGTGTHDIVLSWCACMTDVEGYYVYRGTVSGGESSTPLNSMPITGGTYVDTNVVAGTTYYYVVRAVTSSGLSASSNEASATGL
jgi:hypothetical protein